MTSRTVTIWIVMDEAGDCEVATDKDVALDRWNDKFLEEDIIGPPKCRFVKLNVTMPAPLVTDVTEVDVTVPDEVPRSRRAVARGDAASAKAPSKPRSHRRPRGRAKPDRGRA
jgi:hypothetical protein